MTKEYSHFYRKNVEGHTGPIRNPIDIKLQQTFPNMQARLITSIFGDKQLAYRIPTIGGLNELTLSEASYGGDGKLCRNTVELDLTTTGFFQDRINKTLNRLLNYFELTENTEIATFREISSEELRTRKNLEFHLATANKTVAEILKKMQISRKCGTCIDDIYSSDLGEYLVLKITEHASNISLPLSINYNPKLKKLEVQKISY